MRLKRPSLVMTIELIIMVIALLCMMVSMIPGLAWANYERDGAIGPIGYNLEGEFDAVGFRYSLETVESEGGGIIGIGGGLANDFNISKRKTYPQVKGEFLDNLGILYNSYRTKEFQYELKLSSVPQDSGITWEGVGNPSVKMNVTLEADLIPWWPVSGKRDLDVRIEMKEADLWEELGETERSTLSVQINKITLMAKVDYDPETGEYSENEETIAEKETSLIFNEPGDKKKVSFSVGYPSGEEVVGFYVKVQGNMTDYWGRPELSPLSGKPNPINVYPMSTGKLIQGFGIPLALPLMIISAILALVAAVFSVIKEKFKRSLFIPSAVLSLIAPIWFFIGMRAAVNLLGERLEGAAEGLSWGPGLFISLIGGLLLTSVVVTDIVHSIVSKRNGGTQEDEGPGIKKDPPVFKRTDETDPSQKTEPIFRKI